MFKILILFVLALVNLDLRGASNSCCAVTGNPVSTISGTDLANLQIAQLNYSSETCLIGLGLPGPGTPVTGSLVTATVNSIDTCPNGCQATLGTFAGLASTDPSAFALSNNGNCLAVTNSPDNQVTMFSLASNCTLTQLANSGTGAFPSSAVFTKDDSCLFVSNFNDSSISIFPVTDKSNCVLGTPTVFGPDSVNLAGPTQLLLSSSGTCLIVLNNPIVFPAVPSTLSLYSITKGTNSCTLTLMSSVPLLIPPLGTRYFASLSSNDCLALVLSDGIGSYTLSTYKLSNCTLTLQGSTTITSSNFNSLFLSFSPDGACLAIPSTSNPTGHGGPTAGQVTFFSMNNYIASQSGSPLSISSFAPFVVAYSPSGKCFSVGGFMPGSTTGGTGSIQTYTTNLVLGLNSLAIDTSTCGQATISSTCVTPGASIVISENGKTLKTGTADTNGTFSITITGLSGGLHNFTVTATSGSCSNSLPISGTVKACPPKPNTLILGGSNFNSFACPPKPKGPRCYAAGMFSVSPFDPYSSTGGDVLNPIGCDFTVQKLNNNNFGNCSFSVKLNVPFCRRLTAFAFGTEEGVSVAQTSNNNFIISLSADACVNGATVNFIALPTT